MTSMDKKKVMWTKGMMRSVAENWATKSKREIAEELGIEEKQVAYIAFQLRKNGVKIARKRQNGISKSLIAEFLQENPEYKA